VVPRQGIAGPCARRPSGPAATAPHDPARPRRRWPTTQSHSGAPTFVSSHSNRHPHALPGPASCHATLAVSVPLMAVVVLPRELAPRDAIHASGLVARGSSACCWRRCGRGRRQRGPSLFGAHRSQDSSCRRRSWGRRVGRSALRRSRLSRPSRRLARHPSRRTAGAPRQRPPRRSAHPAYAL
jgi:hypothetical protein